MNNYNTNFVHPKAENKRGLTVIVKSVKALIMRINCKQECVEILVYKKFQDAKF